MSEMTPTPELKMDRPTPAFRAVVGRIDQWQTIMDFIEGIRDEVFLQVNAGGIHLAFFDRSRIILAAVDLFPTFFTDFTCRTPVTFGMAATNLKKTAYWAQLGQGREGPPYCDTITLSFVQKTPKTLGTLTIDIEDEHHAISRKFEFTEVGLLDEFEPINLDEFKLDTPCCAGVSGDAFTKILECASHIYDKVRITVTPNALTFTNTGDPGKCSQVLKPPLGLILSKDIRGSGRYKIAYLKKIVKTRALCCMFKMFFGKEVPLHIEIPVLQSRSEDTIAPVGKLTVFLAPDVDVRDEFYLGDD